MIDSLVVTCFRGNYHDDDVVFAVVVGGDQ